MNYKQCIYYIRGRLKDSTKEGVSLIMATNKPKFMDKVYENYLRINYEPKQLIIILNNNQIDKEDYNKRFENIDNVSIFQLDEKITLGQCLNYAVENSKYDYIAKMDDDDYYGQNYLMDLMDVFKYTDAEVTGKTAHFVYFEKYNILAKSYTNLENKYVDWVKGGTILFKKSVFNKVKFEKVNIGEDMLFFKSCRNNDIKIFSSNKYNYVYNKHENIRDHTWTISTKKLITRCDIICRTNEFENYVDL